MRLRNKLVILATATVGVSSFAFLRSNPPGPVDATRFEKCPLFLAIHGDLKCDFYTGAAHEACKAPYIEAAKHACRHWAGEKNVGFPDVAEYCRYRYGSDAQGGTGGLPDNYKYYCLYGFPPDDVTKRRGQRTDITMSPVCAFVYGPRTDDRDWVATPIRFPYGGWWDWVATPIRDIPYGGWRCS